MKKTFIIPLFVSHEGCPHKCVFCDQHRITGRKRGEKPDIHGTVTRHLSTIKSGANVEIGFFGGTFTGIARETQEGLLKDAFEFVKRGKVGGIRVSTRPDYIDNGILDLLVSYGVKCVELGVQSMSDSVLAASKRGYTSARVETASRMIAGKGLRLGHQMMLGLPGSAWEDELYTARRAAELGAGVVRIYPLVVIKDTELADLYGEGRYRPLSDEEAIERAAELLLFFRGKGIDVIRCGLHPSEGLVSGEDCLAGPFHPAFRQRAESRIFGRMLRRLADMEKVREIRYNPCDEALLYGFKKENSRLVCSLRDEKKTVFIRDTEIPRGELRSDGSGEVTVC